MLTSTSPGVGSSLGEDTVDAEEAFGGLSCPEESFENADLAENDVPRVLCWVRESRNIKSDGSGIVLLLSLLAEANRCSWLDPGLVSLIE
jgi:hypothetical protein